ncbi:hypothetical protein FRC12_024695 [Ceratobasidium sp. 428]|nr:hypothetical protein FRC12_024695 [Ceratobasidium sp. 428]
MDFDFWALVAHDASGRVKSLSRTVDAHGVIQDTRAWIVGLYTDIKLLWEQSDGPMLLEAGLEVGKELYKEYYPQYRDQISRFLMQPYVRKLWITWFTVFGATLVFPLFLGFGPEGVRRDSIASRYQSRVYRGLTPRNSLFAACTRASMGSIKEALLEATGWATQITFFAWVVQKYGPRMYTLLLDATKDL